jgi:predicted GH43/DUF377 family glycosyl hydrolase
MKYGTTYGTSQNHTYTCFGSSRQNPPLSKEQKKARLCIQGFLQIPEVDYGTTFAPTGNFTTLLILLMFAVDKKLLICQFDVKSAFLYAPLKEEIYIKTKGAFSQTQKIALRVEASPHQLVQDSHWVVLIHQHRTLVSSLIKIATHSFSSM